MLFNIARENKIIPFILVRRNEPHRYFYITEYKMFYDYEDNKFQQSGNEELREVYSTKHIQKIFKELTKKANTKIIESKIFVKFDKTPYGIIEWEIHEGTGVLTQIGIENAKVTDISLLTYYPDWLDIFKQPKGEIYEFNNITTLNLNEDDGGFDEKESTTTFKKDR